jgi:hypothetical protein
VAVPYDHFVSFRWIVEETGNCRVDFSSQKLAHFLIFRIGLVLAADSGYTFSVRDQKDGPAGLSRKTCGYSPGKNA